MTDKETVIDRIARREAQRIEQLKRKHETNVEDTHRKESTSFESVFKDKASHIQFKLDEITSAKEAIETSQLQSYFDTIKKDILELQKIVMNSSLILKEYDMKKFLTHVQNLESKCFEMEEKYIPRKKFGFSKKKTEKVLLQSTLPQKKDTVDGIIANKSKWEDTLYGFDKREYEVVSMTSDELFERDVSIRHSKNSTFILKGVLGTLHLSNLDTCVILCGPVYTSVFVDKCTNCKIVVMCQQLRMHSSISCDIYLHVTSKGIIEDCSKIRTAPYNLAYDGLKNDIIVSSLDNNTNNWDKLDDFNWLSIEAPSPNWSILKKEERITNWNEWFTKYPKI